MAALAQAEPQPNRHWTADLMYEWLLQPANGGNSAAAIWYNLGVELAARDDTGPAVTAYANALLLHPTLWQAAINLAGIQEKVGDPTASLSTLDAALQDAEARVNLLNQRGRLLEKLHRLEEAEATYYQSLLTNPDQHDVLQHWSLCARTCAHGPCSAPVGSHAMSYLIVELLERHDRDRFEIYGYCYSPEDDSEMRRRMLAALDHCRLVRDQNHEALARQIRADEIDILIDLNGITEGERLDVLRWKPAPVQITYLGFIGPIPVPELDYLLTDEYAIPPAVADQYWPRPLYLPGVYQANDSQAMALPVLSRAMEGLPTDKFIYCCFCGPYKISDAMFAAWMRILASAKDSVLWLLDDNKWAVANLRRPAQAQGVDPERLIFSARAVPGHYRARMALADLFLDTTPYNAGTVASDALRMGLPVLTLSRETFASRMAGSLLLAMGLPELITVSDDAYVDQAVALYADRTLYDAIRARTLPARWRATLGDTENFTRGFELTLERMAIRQA